jgi:energy-coupling factor transport system ATP-binding protein
VAEEDIAFGSENIGIPSEQIRLRVDEALDAVRMGEFASYTPSKLSGGQKQRIAIAGVLAMKPDCIVLDEPTAMLDPKGRREVMDTIRNLNREKGITVVLITHHMEEAAQCDRVVVLHQGRVALDGTPEQVFSQVETLHDIRLCAPETVELCHILEQKGYQLASKRLTTEECAQTLYDFLKV